MNVRLLDPPLHEFVPHDLAGQQIMADEMGISVQEIQRRVNSLSEHNPHARASVAVVSATPTLRSR